MRSLDLFSGIGGISLALEEYFETIGYVEIDKYAQAVLLSRMASGDIETAPIFRDITRLDGTKLRGHVDCIVGGFPCQDISVAGLGKGLDGKRSGLFFEIVRLVKEIQPVFIFLENVPAIRTRGLDVVLKELTSFGYDCRWTTISAASVGAPHKRERWFLLAHSNSTKLRNEPNKLTKCESKTVIGNYGEEKSMGYSKHNGRTSTQITRSYGENDREESQRENQSCEFERTSEHRNVSGDFSESELSNPMCEGLEGQRKKPIGAIKELINTFHNSWWKLEPNVGRVVNGLPDRAHRIKCLGNSVVPLQVKTAFERLIGFNK